MTADPHKTKPEADREGDLDDDRQDVPVPEPAAEDGDELDGFTATPGDEVDSAD